MPPRGRSKWRAQSVKGLVHDAEGRMLLLRRALSSRRHPGWWDLPGGKVDTGEAPRDSLVREVREETGLAISVSGFAGRRAVDLPDRTLEYLLFNAHAEGGTVVLSPEHSEYRWATWQELLALAGKTTTSSRSGPSAPEALVPHLGRLLISLRRGAQRCTTE